ncbi:MAG: hypothetical protein R3E64_12210 [Halioglobus sp.]
MIGRPHSNTLQLCIAGLFLFTLSSCSERTPEDNCRAVGDNLLQDTRFTTLAAPRPQRLWKSSAHSAQPSFIYSAQDGVLTIEQKGTEPWIIITQSPDAEKLAGAVVEFSAEIKLDLIPPEIAHGFKQGGGLRLLARHSGQIVLNSLLDHQPHDGIHDWQTVKVVMAMPATMDYLQAGFIHQSGGVLQVRNPSLRQMAQSCATHSDH